MTEDDLGPSIRGLAKARDINIRWELRLETRTCRYWLCTQGADKPGSGLPPNYLVGYVTPESKQPGGGGQFGQPYGPAQTDELQDIDYVNLIKEQIDIIAEEYEKRPSEAVLVKLEAARTEYEAMFKKWRDERGAR